MNDFCFGKYLKLFLISHKCRILSIAFIFIFEKKKMNNSKGIKSSREQREKNVIIGRIHVSQNERKSIILSKKWDNTWSFLYMFVINEWNLNKVRYCMIFIFLYHDILSWILNLLYTSQYQISRHFILMKLCIVVEFWENLSSYANREEVFKEKSYWFFDNEAINRITHFGSYNRKQTRMY